MFVLQELFNDLAYGEFANMAIGNSNTGSITPDKYPKVVSFINLGLVDLYSRFILRKKECVIHQRPGKTLYYVRAEHMGNPLGGDPEIYIDGIMENPPDNDIICFIEAFDEMGIQIPINIASRKDGLFLPEPDVISMVPSDPPKIISIVYQAAYPKIVITGTFDPLVYPLYFPSFLRTALMAHVASRFYVGKETKAAEGEAHLTNTFLYRYEAECVKIISNSLIPAVTESAEQFDSNGWV